MNVEFQCKEKVGNEEDYEDQNSRPTCNRRVSTIPGNPYGIHCHLHPEGTLIQTEFYGGADFLNVEEDGHTMSRGHVPTAGAKNIPQGKYQDPPPPTTTTPEAERLAALRTTYEELSKELGLTQTAKLSWGAQRLAAEVDLLRGKVGIQRQEAEERAAQEAATAGKTPAPAPGPMGPVAPPAVLAPGEQHADDTGAKL